VHCGLPRYLRVSDAAARRPYHYQRAQTQNTNLCRVPSLPFQNAVEEFDDPRLAMEPKHWITHHVGSEQRQKVERLSRIEEYIGKLHRMLNIDVVVGETVNEQEWLA